MKTAKKISAILVAAVMLICMAACGNKLDSFKIVNGESVSLEVGYTVRLKTDAPDDVVSEIEWSASNDCVTVDSTGYVIAKKAGEADVTAKYGKQTATIKVTVTASSQGTGTGTTDTPTQTPSTDNGTSSTPSQSGNNNTNTNTNTNKPSGSTGNGNTNTNTGTSSTTNIKTGVAYKLFINNGTAYYAKNTTQNNEGKFVLTDTLSANGADFYAESASGGYKFYTTVNGSKQYLTGSIEAKEDGKISKFLGFSTSGSVFKYNSTVKAWYTTISGDNYYMGTYGTYTTLSLSTENYFTDSSKRASQYEANFVEKSKAPAGSGSSNNNNNTGSGNAPAGTTNIKTGVAYKLFLNNGTVYYATAKTQDDAGKFVLTETSASKGADFYAEAASGGYKFYTNANGIKEYLTGSIEAKDDGKVSKYLGFSANGSVFKYNSSVKAWYTTIDGANYYIGTYGTWTTVSLSTENYFTDSSKRATQFEANFVAK